MAKTAVPTDKDSAAVAAFMAALDHPMAAEVAMLRDIVTAADPGVCERIKWNAPSFFFRDDFATVNLRPPGVGLILHTGAKAKASADAGVTIDDPRSLLKWLAKDRAIVAFGDAAAIEANRPALTAILRQWIAQMTGPE
jgi:hypothetical protein